MKNALKVAFNNVKSYKYSREDPIAQAEETNPANFIC